MKISNVNIGKRINHIFFFFIFSQQLAFGNYFQTDNIKAIKDLSLKYKDKKTLIIINLNQVLVTSKNKILHPSCYKYLEPFIKNKFSAELRMQVFMKEHRSLVDNSTPKEIKELQAAGIDIIGMTSSIQENLTDEIKIYNFYDQILTNLGINLNIKSILLRLNEGFFHKGILFTKIFLSDLINLISHLSFLFNYSRIIIVEDDNIKLAFLEKNRNLFGSKELILIHYTKDLDVTLDWHDVGLAKMQVNFLNQGKWFNEKEIRNNPTNNDALKKYVEEMQTKFGNLYPHLKFFYQNQVKAL